MCVCFIGTGYSRFPRTPERGHDREVRTSQFAIWEIFWISHAGFSAEAGVCWPVAADYSGSPCDLERVSYVREMNQLEADIVARCIKRDSLAWSILVERLAPLVLAIARTHQLDESSADDVAQSVFAKLLKSLPSLREHDAIWGWVSTTTRRECLLVLKSRNRDRTDQFLATSVEPTKVPADDEVARLEQLARVRSKIEELGGKCRDLLTRLYLRPGATDYAAVAKELGMSEGSIGPTRQRCLAKLLEMLEARTESTLDRGVG